MQHAAIFAPVQTEQEIQTLAGLAKTIWNECFVGIISRGQIAYMVEKFQSAGAIAAQIQTDGYAYFLVRGAGGPMGYMGLQARDGKMLLSKLYFLPECRGTGAAQQALAFAEAYAAENGCGVLWLTVNRHNTRAVAAYQKRGFQTVRTQVADIGGGFVMDDFVMEKELGSEGAVQQMMRGNAREIP